jgi:hypothetical protein
LFSANTHLAIVKNAHLVETVKPHNVDLNNDDVDPWFHFASLAVKESGAYYLMESSAYQLPVVFTFATFIAKCDDSQRKRWTTSNDKAQRVTTVTINPETEVISHVSLVEPPSTVDHQCAVTRLPTTKWKTERKERLFYHHKELGIREMEDDTRISFQQGDKDTQYDQTQFTVECRFSDVIEPDFADINSTRFGEWCAEKMCGFFYPDDKLVQTGIRAVFVKGSNTTHPHYQIDTLIKAMKQSKHMAGFIPGRCTSDKARNHQPSDRSTLYAILANGPEAYALLMPLTVTLSGKTITPTLMDVDGWYIVTPQYYAAESIVVTEIQKVVRTAGTATGELCCEKNPVAFGSALISQALITCQTLDHGLQFKDRSALRLSTAQRKTAIYAVARSLITHFTTETPASPNTFPVVSFSE